MRIIKAVKNGDGSYLFHVHFLPDRVLGDGSPDPDFTAERIYPAGPQGEGEAEYIGFLLEDLDELCCRMAENASVMRLGDIEGSTLEDARKKYPKKGE